MTDEDDLGAVARSIIDRNRFMTLATADAEGLPWASPVWYAPKDPRELFWVSSPDARHSRNIEVRPQVAIVIFDSHLAGGWESLYMSAVAERGMLQMKPAVTSPLRSGSASGPASAAYWNRLPGPPSPVR